MVVEIKRRFRVRPVGFRFDAMAAFLMCQHHGVDLDGLEKIPQKEYLSSWVWSAHRSYCMDKCRRAMPYEAMNVYVARMRKSEWDAVLKAMSETSTPQSDDKKKAQTGMNSLSGDGKQE